MRTQAVHNLYLVRHAHADWSLDEARPLSRSGAAAALRVADLLAATPIKAIYSSPSRRAVDTVSPLAQGRGLTPGLVPDLRERELPPVPALDFDGVVRDTWQFFDRTPHGGESNLAAQARGLAAVEAILTRHPTDDVVVATHGTLMVLILSRWDASFDFDFWRRLSFPDIYRVRFEAGRMSSAERVWDSEPSS